MSHKFYYLINQILAPYQSQRLIKQHTPRFFINLGIKTVNNCIWTQFIYCKFSTLL